MGQVEKPKFMGLWEEGFSGNLARAHLHWVHGGCIHKPQPKHCQPSEVEEKKRRRKKLVAGIVYSFS